MADNYWAPKDDTEKSSERQSSPRPVKIVLYKGNEKGDALSGAYFKLIGQDGTQQVTISDGEGRMSFFVLPMIGYTLLEIEAPDGYAISEGRHTVVADWKGSICVDGLYAPRFVIKNSSVPKTSAPEMVQAEDTAPEDAPEGQTEGYIGVEAGDENVEDGIPVEI